MSRLCSASVKVYDMRQPKPFDIGRDTDIVMMFAAPLSVVLAFSTRSYARFDSARVVTRVAELPAERRREEIAAYFGDFDPFGDFDLIFGAAKLDLKIVDLPIRYRERVYGDTNIHRWSHGWLLLRMTALAYRKRETPGSNAGSALVARARTSRLVVPIEPAARNRYLQVSRRGTPAIDAGLWWLGVINVALACGYSSHSHFTASFRKGLGLTPSAYAASLVSGQGQTPASPVPCGTCSR